MSESVDPPHVVKLPWHLKLSPNLTPEEADAQLRAWVQVEKLRAESLVQPSMLLRYYWSGTFASCARSSRRPAVDHAELLLRRAAVMALVLLSAAVHV